MGSKLEDLAFATAQAIGCPTAPVKTGWELTIPVDGGRSQAVTLQEFSHDEESFVRFSTRVGPRENLSPKRLEKALGMNFRLPHGCLAVEGDDLVMTETLPLGSATTAHAAAILRFLAHQADLYERVLFEQDVN